MKAASEASFQWECQPNASAIVQQLVDEFCARAPSALRLKEKLLRETGTRLVDWVDVTIGEELDTAALAAGYVTEEQAAQFATRGAIGLHLEVLERNEGYKGFNQTGISQIIRRTDPRMQVAESVNA